MNILVLNVGSSSLKGRLYGLAAPIPSDPVEPLWDLQADWASRDGPAGMRIRTKSGALLDRIDPHVEVPAVPFTQLAGMPPGRGGKGKRMSPSLSKCNSISPQASRGNGNV